uniref:2,4-dienoyl-CoA reductase [(3E)-enoyl-CoA-producing] n=1 Tax=Gambierdiscus polynesiensis TaxID=439318 RepID=A0A6M5KG51_9DINO|nr:2,4 dienoyl reductase 2 [Gambierdiscus polynesiensis]
MPEFKTWFSTSPFRSDILDDRVALVTGGGSGIGFEVARQLGLHGAALVLMGRREGFLRDASEALTREGIRVVFVAGDVRKPDDCGRCVRTAVECYGFLNVVVNSAAGMFPASMGETLSSNGFKTVLDIDVMGTYNMNIAALPELKKTGQSVIINITVPRHFLEGRNWWVGHMQSAKAAITTMSHAQAKEWAEYGIRVCNVGPGNIADTPAQLKTGSSQGISSQSKKVTKDGIPAFAGSPLGRMGRSFEIGMAAVFLCVSEYVTAETLVVDGGWWLGGEPASPPRERVGSLTRANEARSRGFRPSDAQRQSKL